jgi:GLPGLI family protein
MKKTIKTLVIAIICVSTSIAANAQKILKEGILTYSTNFELPPDQAAMAAMLPSEFVVYIKGNVSKYKMDLGMFAVENYYDAATQQNLTLTDVPMQGKKIAVISTKEQTKQLESLQAGEKDFEVTSTKETKNIAGYNCTKFIIKDKISGDLSEAWTTTEITVLSTALTSTLPSGITGFPVMFSTNMNGVKNTMTLKSIEEKAVGEVNFKIPEGYETMTFEALLKQMGG